MRYCVEVFDYAKQQWAEPPGLASRHIPLWQLRRIGHELRRRGYDYRRGDPNVLICEDYYPLVPSHAEPLIR